MLQGGQRVLAQRLCGDNARTWSLFRADGVV